MAFTIFGSCMAFQSTLPIREETRMECYNRCGKGYFNPLFPYGKRHGDVVFPRHIRISIHSSHTGRDALHGVRVGFAHISIHSSHTGRDDFLARRQPGRRYFNPLFPYGKRRFSCPAATGQKIFQSTLPIREETPISIHHFHNDGFQSTLPIREETGKPFRKDRHDRHFNPLFPYGKRRVPLIGDHLVFAISIHSSHTGRDRPPAPRKRGLQAFQSTLPIREETVTVT